MVYNTHRPRPPCVWQVLADFVREPTTYVIVGVENIERSSRIDTADTFGEEDERHGETPVSGPKVSAGNGATASGSIVGSSSSSSSRSISCSPRGVLFGAETKHPMKWQRTETSLMPAPRIWVGL